VNSTEVVAIIGASSTVGVAVAGYGFNYLAAGRLARQAQQHERQLADAAHAHERQLRQGERAYDDRKTTYRQVLAWALVTVQQVVLTEPLITFGDMPEPPEDVSAEDWRAMLVEVGLFGSPTVSDAMEAFRDKVHEFRGHVMTYRTLRDQGATQQLTQSREAMQRAKTDTSTAYDQLTRQIRDELANL
jgi:hypothetical protein